MEERKGKILEIIKEKGPVLPLDVAKEIETDLLISSAILSEMVRQKELHLSYLKIGSSPLYYLPGKKGGLEDFADYLPPKEKKVFDLLKKKSFVDDEKLGQAERIAIRNLRDFAIPLKVTHSGKDHIFWRFYSVPKEDVSNKIKEMIEKKREKLIKKEELAKETIKEEKEVIKDTAKEVKELVKEIIIEDKPEKIEKLIEIPLKMSAKGLAFKEKILDYAKNSNIKITRENIIENAEMLLTGLINSEIGELPYLIIAKDKKSINESDLSMAYYHSQNEKMPVLFITNGKLTAKGKVYAESLKGQIIFKQMK